MMTAQAIKTGSDFATVIKAAGSLKLTKTWKADGTIRGYDEAANFRIKTYPISGIRELYALLSDLAHKPQCCIIRGDFIGEKQAQSVLPPEIPGHYRRKKALFNEAAHHWVLTDIDGFRPETANPVLEPVKAIDEYITSRLPSEFHGVSYVWQLSASAGAPGKEGILKAHVWFWLETAYTGPQLEAWARVTGAELDISVLRRVQPNYTAAPMFEEGVTDPVPSRMGFEEGWAGDEVPLLITEGTLARAREADGDDFDLVDPKQKPGLIGLFCQTYSIEEVLENWLSDVFELQDGSDRRLNYLQGGGAPGGAFISDDREYIINTHNTDPLLGRAANKWDLVRWYLFGDKDSSKDAFELMDVAARPSQLAMLEMVAALPEIKDALREKNAAVAGEWKGKIEAAADEFVLREVAEEVAKAKGLDPVAVEQLAGLVQERFKDFGIKIPIAMARDLVGRSGRGRRVASTTDDCPGWAQPWVYVHDGDKFFSTETKDLISERGFNAQYTREMQPYADPSTGMLPPASSYALNLWRLPCVMRTIYMPPCGPVFEMLGSTWANTYRPDTVPGVVDYKVEGSYGWKAVEAVKRHLRLMFPNRRERRLLASWLAHNVQKPGVKIRWAPYLHGYEGDGKSYFISLLGAAMGGKQVRSVSGSTLESNFTDWALGHAVIAIEEMKQHGHNRYEVMNRIKPFITNSEVEIHPKGKASYYAPNVSNYIIFSNYLDGAPIDENSRRYMFLSSAIRPDEVLKMNEEGYFSALFEALQQPEALRSWLLEFELDAEFDANGRAPHTAVRRTVVELSRTETESLARDAIEHGVEGVCKTAVSSAHLSIFLKNRLGDDAEIATSRISGLLSKLGFRLYDRKKWRQDARRIWVTGDDRSWAEIKKELDATIGLEFDFNGEDGEDEI